MFWCRGWVCVWCTPVRQLASIGTSGLHPNHMHRDIMRTILGGSVGQLSQNNWTTKTQNAQIFEAEQPKGPKPTTPLLQALLTYPWGFWGQELWLKWLQLGGCLWFLPGLLVEHMDSACPRHLPYGHMSYLLVFGSTISKPSRPSYWEGEWRWCKGSGPECLPDLQCRTGHNGRGSAYHWHCMGDGVAITNIRGKASKSMDTLSWSSLLSSAPTKYSVFLIWVCFAHMAKTRGFSTTWTMFWKRLSKSLLALWQGTWPHEDMEGNIDPRGGQPLAGGFFAIPYVCRGGLDWMAHHYGLNHTGSATPCSLCRCTNHGEDEIPWTDCNSPPRWLRTCLDDEVLGYRFGNVSLNVCNFPLQKPKLEQLTMAQDLWSFTLKSRESEQKGVPTKAVNPRLLCKNILMLILSFDQIRHQVEGSAFTNQTTCIPNCWVWMLIYLEVAWPIWSKRTCPSQLTTMSLPCGKQFRSTTSSTILLVGLGALLRICWNMTPFQGWQPKPWKWGGCCQPWHISSKHGCLAGLFWPTLQDWWHNLAGWTRLCLGARTTSWVWLTVLSFTTLLFNSIKCWHSWLDTSTSRVVATVLLPPRTTTFVIWEWMLWGQLSLPDLGFVFKGKTSCTWSRHFAWAATGALPHLNCPAKWWRSTWLVWICCCRVPEKRWCQLPSMSSWDQVPCQKASKLLGSRFQNIVQVVENPLVLAMWGKHAQMRNTLSAL